MTARPDEELLSRRTDDGRPAAERLRRMVMAMDIVHCLRTDFGLTQSTIGKATHATYQTVRNWERGRRPTLRHRDRIGDLAEVVAILAGTLSPPGVGEWLGAHHRALGSRPVDAIAAGEVDRVIEAAQSLVDGLAAST